MPLEVNTEAVLSILPLTMEIIRITAICVVFQIFNRISIDLEVREKGF